MVNQNSVSFRRKSVKRIIISVLVVVLFGIGLAGMGTATAQSAPNCLAVTYDGDGTEDEPFEVGNLDQLQCIGENHGSVPTEGLALESSYVLVGDIDASETRAWDGGFDPIGEIDNEFEGGFDGDGNAVQNLLINREDEVRVAVFGRIGDATVESVDIVDSEVRGDQVTGALVGSGWNSSSLVEDVGVENVKS